MKRISFFLFVAVVVLTSVVPAFAAFQDIKFSGDITVRNMWRRAYDLDKDNDHTTYNGGRFGDSTATNATARIADQYMWWMQQVRFRSDVNMTDNVSGHIEFLNQRDWDSPNLGTQGSPFATDGGGNDVGYETSSSSASSGVITGATSEVTNDQFDVTLNKAHITVKEFLYGPLTLDVGRNDRQFGQGFVIGANQVGQPDLQNSIVADEYTQSHAHDSVDFKLDLAPWAAEFLIIQVTEDSISADDDGLIFGVNVGRTFEAYDSEVEVYWVHQRNSEIANSFAQVNEKAEKITDFGIRGSASPITNLRVNGEVVFQVGQEGIKTVSGGTPSGLTAAVNDFSYNGNIKQEITAWATDFRGEFDVTQTPWPVTLGAGHVFYSGEDPNEEGRSANYRPLMRGKFYSAIREFQGIFYLPFLGVSPGSTNQHQIMFDASLHPFNNPDLTFFTRYLSFWFHHTPVGPATPLVTSDNHGGRSKHIGDEVDLNLKWDYTEDLTFDLLYAFFVPGGYFDETTDEVESLDVTSNVREARDVAQSLVTSVTLNFG